MITIRKEYVKQILLEYIILLLGVCVSYIICMLCIFVLDGFKFERSLNDVVMSAYLVFAFYLIFTGYFILILLSPIFGLMLKNFYKKCFYFLILISIFYFILACQTYIIHVMVFLALALSPMPISYFLAWRKNHIFWQKIHSSGQDQAS